MYPILENQVDVLKSKVMVVKKLFEDAVKEESIIIGSIG